MRANISPAVAFSAKGHVENHTRVSFRAPAVRSAVVMPEKHYSQHEEPGNFLLNAEHGRVLISTYLPRRMYPMLFDLSISRHFFEISFRGKLLNWLLA